MKMRNGAENLLVGLSPAQECAVKSKSSYIKVIAGAGAGKTETITRRILYLLTTDPDLRPKNIVAFTFTEMAAQSMKDRIYMKLKEIRKQDVLQEIGDMFIGTVHSFCLRLLQEHFKCGEYIVLDDAVQVMTIHQAKGLEWSIVFLPYLNRGVFPSSHTNSTEEFDIPEELFDSRKYKTSIEDERRLFYVAITRAKDALILSSSKENSLEVTYFKPSTFLTNPFNFY